MKSYSQNEEDIIISEYFGDFKGILLDIGANDGVTFSNSKLLIDNGWEAVLVEPSLAYDKMSTLHYPNKLVERVCIAIGAKRDVVTWYELSDSLLSTTSKFLADSWGIPYNTREIDVIPYSTIADSYRPFDFITIDAEGSDWIILQQIDLSYTKCLCIEYGKYETEITDYCKMFHMKQLHRNGENLIFIK